MRKARLQIAIRDVKSERANSPQQAKNMQRRATFYARWYGVEEPKLQLER